MTKTVVEAKDRFDGKIALLVAGLALVGSFVGGTASTFIQHNYQVSDSEKAARRSAFADFLAQTETFRAGYGVVFLKELRKAKKSGKISTSEVVDAFNLVSQNQPAFFKAKEEIALLGLTDMNDARDKVVQACTVGILNADIAALGVTQARASINTINAAQANCDKSKDKFYSAAKKYM
jgi:hypothetical protein